jgi:hypothetical protein
MTTDSGCRHVCSMKAQVVVATVLLMQGCRQPTEVDRDNRRLLDAIITALSMSNEKWLSEDEQLLQTRHAAGHITDDEFQQLEAVIGQARRGQWSGAEEAAYQFRKQRPFVREGH